MAEIITASLEDYLIDGLSFKLSKTASYVTNRRLVTYHPQGSNIYSTNGTKLIKFHISGSDWLDPSTFRVMFDLVNTNATADRKLRPIGGPWSFSRECECYVVASFWKTWICIIEHTKCLVFSLHKEAGKMISVKASATHGDQLMMLIQLL